MTPELLQPQDVNSFLDLDDPNYPPTRVGPMTAEDCQDVIESGWAQVNPDEIDLPRRYAQWLLQGDTFIRRRPDLEKKFTTSPTIIEIKQTRRVAIVVIADESLPCDKVKFEPYNPDKHPDFDSIQVFTATPAEAVKLLEQAEAFSQAPGSAQKLQNTRKAGASRGISNTANI